jgi:hypothetical protein
MNSFTFTATNAEALGGVLYYHRPHHSFHFEPGSPVDLLDRAGDEGVASLLIDTLSVEVGVATRTLIVVEGYRPNLRWPSEQLTPPPWTTGLVTVRTEFALQRGVGHSLGPDGSWSTTYDAANGWVRIAVDKATQHVQIATATVVGLLDGRLTEVWLQPIFTDTL